MAGDASIQRFNSPTLIEGQDSLGVTQFGADGTSWIQTIGGLTFQGGVVLVPGPVEFLGANQVQTLGVFMASEPSGVTKTGFTATAVGYWCAIGV